MNFQNPVKNCLDCGFIGPLSDIPLKNLVSMGGPHRQFKWLSERNLVRTGHIEGKRNGGKKGMGRRVK